MLTLSRGRRVLAGFVPLVLSLVLAVGLYRLWPPFFTGNACPGTMHFRGAEIAQSCGVFPIGVFVPILGVAFATSFWYGAFYQRKDEG